VGPSPDHGRERLGISGVRSNPRTLRRIEDGRHTAHAFGGVKAPRRVEGHLNVLALQTELLPVGVWNQCLELLMTFDECFDERTERQYSETSCASVFQSKPDQPITESATLKALVDLGMHERDQAGACAIGGEANHFVVDRQLVAITVGRVSHLDALRHSHARNIRTQTTATAWKPAGRAPGDNYEIRCASCVRDFTSSFRNILRRWYSTVLWVMKS
jgi:hypothetical protein